MMTARQKDLLAYLSDAAEKGTSPSFQEMADALGLKSKSGIHRLVVSLEERGFVRRMPDRARSLQVVRAPRDCDADARLNSAVAMIAAGGYGDASAYARAVRALIDLAEANGVGRDAVMGLAA